MKSVFYFILKALYILKTFKFFLKFQVMQKNGLIRKIRLISKFTRNNLVKKNADIAQYFTRQRQPDNELWSFNRILNNINTLL